MDEFNKPSANFLVHFLENRAHSPCHSQIVNTISSSQFYCNPSNKTTPDKAIIDIHDFPGYLRGDPVQSKAKWRTNRIKTYKGTMIVLKNYQDLDKYLATTFNSNRRSKFRTYKKRLENSFDISYKTYYGNISLSDYESLFDEFHILMTKRFEQKQAINKDLDRWQVYREIGFPLIQNKEACLFVIYDGKKPISICFNIIYGKNIYAYIRAYDINYAKFYVGFTDLINQLQWCFDNGFEVFDMLKGDYSYKSKWTDDEYFFERHIMYNPKNFSASLKANSRILRIKLFYFFVNFLKKFNLHLTYRKLKKKYEGTSGSAKQGPVQKSIDFKDFDGASTNLSLETIDINQEDFSFLRRPVYDYLYKHKESIKDIEVCKLIDTPSSYLIKGSKGDQKFLITQ